MIAPRLHNWHRSKGRDRTEKGLEAAGLVSAAGGTKYRYWTLPARVGDKVGYFWRTSSRTLRLVRRYRLDGGYRTVLKDVACGPEYYHGKLAGVDWPGRAVALLEKRIARAEGDPAPALAPGRLYLGDNGRCFCGALRCAGSSAHFTGRDISGQRVEAIPAQELAAHPTLKCEGCGARPEGAA